MDDHTELTVNLPTEQELNALEKARQKESNTSGNWSIRQNQMEDAKAQGEVK